MYFSIVDKKENYNDVCFKYKAELTSNGPNRLCFTNLQNIHKFYSVSTICWIRQVIVPIDAKIINRYERWCCNEIIMGDRFPLYDLKTIKKFNLNITNFYILEVCKRGKVDILEWWKNSGLELKCDKNALNLASHYSQVEVLEWWKNSGLELKYDETALNLASHNGHVEVLEWWKNSGLELKYTESALNGASAYAKVNVLKWWKNSGLELKYTDTALDEASYYGRRGQVEVLEWWKNSGLELKYSKCAFGWASLNDCINVLEWWKNSGLEIKI